MIEWVVKFAECLMCYSSLGLTFLAGFLLGSGCAASLLRNKFMRELTLGLSVAESFIFGGNEILIHFILFGSAL